MRTILLSAVASLALGAASASAKELKSIGISLGSLGNPFFIALSKGAEAEAKKTNPNVKVLTVGYDYDLNKQFTQATRTPSSRRSRRRRPAASWWSRWTRPPKAPTSR